MTVLSVIIPVHNEERHLRQVLDRVLAAPSPAEREFIAVDDRSTDDSHTILLEYAARRDDFKVIRQPRQGGKGAAVITGIEAATGDLVMVQDADMEYDPADVPALLEPLLDGRADVVYGSRFRREGPQVHRTVHYLGNRLLTAGSNLLSGIYLSDMETCYKIFSADLLKAMKLKSRRFGFEVEVTAYLGKATVRVYELPISYFPRTRQAGKKIGWKDGVAAFGHLVRFNLLTSPSSAFADLPERYRAT